MYPPKALPDAPIIAWSIYKQNGRNLSVIKGFEFVGPKLSGFLKQVLKLKSEELLVYCWRGGMRSASMSWLFETVNLKTYVLQGGYKIYRRYILDSFRKPLKLIVLGGYTGSGKTEILQALEKAGEQVIDLEGLAHHKGSAFGALGQSLQPTQEMFENQLFQKISTLDKSLPIWIEDEGKNIGTDNLCNTIWEQLRAAPVIIADTDYNIRLNRILNAYACFSKEELITSIKKIEKRLGYDNFQRALNECKTGNFKTSAEICLTYYDKAYNLQLSTRLQEKYNTTPKVKTDCIDERTINELISFKNIFFYF